MPVRRRRPRDDALGSLTTRRTLMEAPLIKEVQSDFTVNIALGDGGELGTDGPFHADRLGIAVGYILYVSESDVLGNLLLERHSGPWRVGRRSEERRVGKECRS